MKKVILIALALTFSASAMAANTCNKNETNGENNGSSGSGIRNPICYSGPVSRPTSPASNKCKTAAEKHALSNYLNGEKDYRTPPKCYTPAKYAVRAKSWASCTKLEQQKIAAILSANKPSERGAFPACYK